LRAGAAQDALGIKLPSPFAEICTAIGDVVNGASSHGPVEPGSRRAVQFARSLAKEMPDAASERRHGPWLGAVEVLPAMACSAGGSFAKRLAFKALAPAVCRLITL
jgi:hypothetical protein